MGNNTAGLIGSCQLKLKRAIQIVAALTCVLPIAVNALPDEVSSDARLADDVKTGPSIRIIALAPHIVEMLDDIGAYEQIIAASEHSDHPAKAKQLPRVGNYARLSIEKILLLQPDIIIAWKTGVPMSDIEQLQKHGLTVVYSDPRQLEDVAKEFQWLGKLTGRRDIAEQKAKEYRTRLANLRQQYQDKQRIKVFYELWPKPLTTVAGNAWPQQQLTVCGATNPFKDAISDYPQINLEQVIVANPSIIIQPTSSHGLASDAIDWQQYNSVRAAQHQQIIRPNADILHRMSYRLLDELQSLCQHIDNSRLYYRQRKQNH
ncbi:cobalamin-binding protein [Thalassotalea sp. HSM 43]|uniref:cobalamin-binding protein n=1 Tax=Thalassotalea sp. HSM 43 TaxID=2552945 RepID=UPI001E59A9E4|nr:cobalamin-binding protein [Thalassotalea sp. HSM 43]